MVRRLLRRLLAAGVTTLVANGPLAPLPYLVPHLLARARLAVSAALGRLSGRRPVAG